MNFVWLLSAIALIPILVHLFSFRRAKKQYFSNLKFITKVSTQSKSRSRIKHILILISRFFAFTLLLILIFEFFNDSKNNFLADIDKAFVDRSPSMLIEHETLRSSDQVDQLMGSLDLNEDNIATQNLEFDSYSMVISDFQGRNIEKMKMAVLDTSVNRTFVLTGNINEYNNAFIDSMHLDFNTDDYSQIQIVLYENKSKALDKGNLVYRLFHDQKQLSSIVKNVEDPGRIVFDIPIELHGRFKVEIEGDRVYYDNEFRFIISERTKPVISIISKRPNSYIDQVFANSNLFVTHKMLSNSLDFDKIGESDVIVVNGVSSLPSGVTSEFLEKYVIAFPPIESINELELNWMDLSIKGSNDTTKSEFYLDPKNPILKGIFSNKEEFSSLPYATSSYTIQGNYEIIIPLRNRKPLLIRSMDGMHYFFNVPLDLTQTNLPTHSIFLPILYRIVLSVIEYDTKSFYYPGDLGKIKVEFGESSPKILGGNLEVIPEFNPIEDGIAFQIPELDPGYYQLLYQQDTFQLAVNMPKEESLMEGVTLRELEENFGHLEHVRIQSATKQSISGVEDVNALWKYALILVVFILLTETLFHKYLK